MARIAVVTSHPLFAEGGHLVIAAGLARALGEAGHDAAVWQTPQNRFGRQGAAYLATWLTDVGMTHDGRLVDQVISFRFPSYAVRHPAHVCWLNHRMREYYDQWPAFNAPLSARSRLKERVRRGLVHAADRYLLTHNVTRVFAQSKTVQERLERWGGIPSSVVYPPAMARDYRCDDYGDFVLVVSRLAPLKRVGLVLDALAEPVAAGVRCVILGDGGEMPALRQQLAAHGLESRVTLFGAANDAELVDHLARCRAVCYPALQEDYGLVTLEAFASAKPVITCLDSGGPTELVTDGGTGLVSAPDAASLGRALARLGDDRSLAERLGAAARTRAASITWERTVERLLLV